MKISTLSYVHISELREGSTFPWADYVDFTQGFAAHTLVQPGVLIEIVAAVSQVAHRWNPLLQDLYAVDAQHLLVGFDG